MDAEQNWADRLREITSTLRAENLDPSSIEYCPTCGTTKSAKEFSKNSNRRNGLQSECRLCQNARSQTGQHEMSVDDYELLMVRQKRCCAICGTPANTRRLHIDHDHTVACGCDKKSCTICRRGLLCGNCNAALGMFRDDTTIMTNAIAYIERWRNTPK